MLAATVITGESLVGGLITLLVVGLIFWLLWWLIAYVAPPEPFQKIARVVLAVLAVVFLINWLLAIAGHPLIVWRQ